MIGQLRHRVTIQQNVSTHTLGRRTDDWADIETVYAEIRALVSTERKGLSPAREEATHQVTTRRRINMRDIIEDVLSSPLIDTSDEVVTSTGITKGIKARYRLVFGTRAFDVASVVRDYERNGYVRMTVREVVS